MRLSVIIPAYNEEESIASTVRGLYSTLSQNQIDHEILVVNDNSKDHTCQILEDLSREILSLRYVNNLPPNGYGRAVKKGLAEFNGDCEIICTADGSDDPEDVIRFYRKMQSGEYDCIWGSRFHKQSRITQYPVMKRLVNRIGNTLFMLIFGIRCNDLTNSFKMYKREVIHAVSPLEADGFELTLEIVLKAAKKGCRYTVIPNNWKNRTAGKSSMRIFQEIFRYTKTIWRIGRS